MIPFRSLRRFAAAAATVPLGIALVAAQAPARVRLEVPDTADLISGRAVLTAEVEPSPGAAILEVRFVVDGALLAVDPDPPYEALWTEINPERDHLLRVTAVAEDGSRAYDVVSLPRLGMVQRTTVLAFPPSFVLLDVTFLDAEGRPVVDVRPEELRLLENGNRREIELLEPDDRPLAAELLLDASHSTRPYWEPMARSVELFARTLRPDDRATVEAFHDQSYVIAPMGSPPDAMAGAVRRFVDWGGGTRLFDSLSRAALYTLGPEGAERRALILLTDGVDQGSRLQQEDAQEFLLRGDVELHAVLFDAQVTLWPGVYARNRDGRQARRLIQRMAGSTGGAAYDPEKLPMEEIFLRIGEGLRAQYVLGFNSEAREAPGQPRKVEVKLRRAGGHRVHYRASHFGTEDLGGFLARQLRDSSETRQIVAARAAAVSGDPVAMEALVQALGEGGGLDRGLGREARLGLLSRGMESVPFLRNALEDADLRSSAARVLAEVLVILRRQRDIGGLEAALGLLGEGDPAAGRDRLEALAEEDLPEATKDLIREVLGG